MILDFNKMWVEKYRPQKLIDLILSKENKIFFSNIKDSIPHLLFCSPPGQGKTTLAKIIVKELLQCQYLYINASDENGIDDIRNKVITFAQTRSIDGKIKVIILDEADNLSEEAQGALRNVMEEYADHTRFILTANYFHRIKEPLASRCQIFDLTTDISQYGERLLYILKQENIQLPADLNVLTSFIKKRYPDFRRAIHDLQKFSIQGELKISKDNTNTVAASIVNSIFAKKDIFELRTFIIENEQEFNNNYQKLLKDIFEEIFKLKNLSNNIKTLSLLTVAEFMYRDNMVCDHEINCYNCLLQINSQLS